MLGNTLVGRYQIVSHLGSGGFGETFIAYDTQLPGLPPCVVKQLKPQATDPANLETARRLFETEAQVLYQLGTHDRIPQLLAYFEEGAEFYLVQEYVPGDDLSKELTSGTPLSQDQVSEILQEILTILAFVQQQNVIHRDINPRNILRRASDGKLILIDFGAVKQITTHLTTPEGKSKFTVAVGTPGYMPGEQAQGTPKFSSDIYAVGIIAIQALTGLSPEQLAKDPETNEILWQSHATVSPEFAQHIDKMVRYDFRQRYPCATAALQGLIELSSPPPGTVLIHTTLPSQPRKRIWLKLLLATIILSLGGVAAILMMNYNARELYQQGNTLLELQRYQDALAAYQQATKIKPNYAPGWNGQGQALAAMKKYPAALEAYEKAIQIQADDLEAWNGRGFALLNLQRYSEAITAFNQGLKLKNDSPEIWNAKGEALSKLQQYDQAIKAYEKAIEFQPDDYEAWFNKGVALQNLKQYEQAVTAYDRVIEIQPDYALAWYNRGNALFNLTHYPEAFKAYDQAVKYKPNYALAWLSRGNVLVNLQRYPEAIESFNQVIKYNSHNYEAWYGLGWSLHQNQQDEEAIKAYQRAIELKRNDYLVWYNLGNSQYKLQKYEQAIASYDKAVHYKIDHYQSWYSQGNAFLSLKQYPEAIASYNQAIKYKPNYQPAIDARNQAQLQTEESKPLIRLFNW